MKKLFMLFALVVGSLPLAAQDTTPPTIVSLSYLPASADVTVNPQTIAFTMHVTDDISGVQFITATFTSPSHAQTQNAFLSLSTGTALDGTFTGNATIPKFAESGSWTLSVFIGDKAGNSTILTTGVLAAAGFPTTLPVTSNPDTTAPTVTNISFSAASLDVSAGPQTLTVTLTLTDSPAGVDFADFSSTFPLIFQSPSGLQHKYSAAADFTLTGGTINNGTWQATFTFPQYSEAGTWTIGSLTLHDVAGNQRVLSSATLTGLTSTFTMIDTNPDTMPPAITSFDFSPKLIDTSAAAQNVIVTANITDDLSGVDFSPDNLHISFFHGVSFTSPSHGQSVFCCAFSPAWNLTGGTALSGTWQATLTIPQFSEQGTWKDAIVLLKDQVQNTLSLTTAQVAALGFPTDLVVVKPSLTSDGTVGPAGGTVPDTTFGARAEIIFPPGMVSTTTSVAIDVFSSPLAIPNPHGFSGPGTLFVDINLTPIPSFPLPAPGVTLVLPVSPAAIPGTSLSLFSVDPTLGTLVPVMSTSGTPVVGTVDASGLSATFLNVSHLSIFVGLIPSVTDTTAPVIVPTIAGTLGNNGWYTSNVGVSWSVTDPESGIATSVGCGPTSLTADTAGVTLTCMATNGAGLVTSVPVTIKIDKTPPTVTYSGNLGTYAVGQTVNITCAAADALSGVFSTTCAPISGTFSAGSHTFSATATDNAGNQGGGSTTFTVGGYDSLIALVNQFETKPAVVANMVATLKAAQAAAAGGNVKLTDNQLNSFTNQVKAQSGKSLTAAQAALLIQLATALVM